MDGAFLVDQGVEPRRPHPLTASVPIDGLRHEMSAIRSSIAAAVDSLPSHQQYVARYCSAAAMEERMALISWRKPSMGTDAVKGCGRRGSTPWPM